MSRIQEAYGYYDSDPRAHGPDDYQAFKDAIDKAQYDAAEYNIIDRKFKLGDTVLAWECDPKTGDPIDDHPIATIAVKRWKHAPYDTDNSNKDFFVGVDGKQYLFYGHPKR